MILEMFREIDTNDGSTFEKSHDTSEINEISSEDTAQYFLNPTLLSSSSKDQLTISSEYHWKNIQNKQDTSNKKHETYSNNGKNMVLQLASPQGTTIRNENCQTVEANNNFLLSTTPEHITNFKNKKKQAVNLDSISGSRQDLYSEQHSLHSMQGYVNQAFSTTDLTSNECTVHNSLSYLEKNLNSTSSRDSSHLFSSLPYNKQEIFRNHLTNILSCIYCVFIVTLGVVIYISDVIVGKTPIAETFSIYLVIIGFLYLIYLFIDIRIYLHKLKSKQNVRMGEKRKIQSNDNIEFREMAENDQHVSITLPGTLNQKFTESAQHGYCFNTGRHSGSFYLKIGAAGFCLGHLIHSGLLLGYQIVFLTSSTDDFYACASVATLLLDVLYPLYSFFQLYFIFKYSNVIINRRRELSRFAMMHCIASSLCFWIWTILRETMDSLAHHSYKAEQEQKQALAKISETTFIGTNIGDIPMALPLNTYHQRGAKDLVAFLNDTSNVEDHCASLAGLGHIYENISPYLYPFTVEYSILVVGVLYIIWQNIGKCDNKQFEQRHGSTKMCSLPPISTQNGYSSNLVIHVDCHSANKGLFAGFFVLAISVVSIILFFIAISDQKFVEQGLIINSISELIQLLLMTAAAIIAYRQITKLDINLHPVSLLDDLLLFVCIPAFFLYGIFSIVPAVGERSYVTIINTLLQVIQILIQTPLIIDGLRRCSNSQELRLEKPGRETITFLVVCNVAMWITETFEIKSNDLRDARYDFYGKVLWTIIGHLTVPFTMFYRFHSSVCLVDIWKSAYEPAESH